MQWSIFGGMENLPSIKSNLVDKNKHRRILVRDVKQSYKIEASHIKDIIKYTVQIFKSEVFQSNGIEFCHC